MQNQLKSVKKFHQAFGVKISNKPTLELSKDILKLRHSLMKEENNEYLKAVEEKNLIEVADALGDMLYILCGTILTHGFQNLIEDIFDEIQSSNMSKLGDDGKPIYRNDGKVLKGPNYKKPNIKKIIN
ncbi:MAG: nucleoside triphosphate pyrophosphohydrolase family protein [Bacteroidota bacterium]|nr:nucleoside triphosphate pyrophosphohydrolase family protein [Bacteroidota bacterium]